MNSTEPRTEVRPLVRHLTALLSITTVLALLTGCGRSPEKTGGSETAAARPAGAPAAPAADTKSAPAGKPDAAASVKTEAPFVLPPEAGPADKAWADFQKAFASPPQPPESWATNPPSPDQVAEFQKSQGAMAAQLADVAKDFHTKFAADSRAAEARDHELELLDAAVKLGHTNALVRLEAVEKARLADPKTDEDERFAIRASGAQRKARALAAGDEKAARASFEESARELIKEFPKRPEPYQMLLSLASDAPPEQARATAQSLTSTNVPEAVREAAAGLLRKLDLIGKPVDLKYTAVDGREVDLAKLRGKVVLIDFWATWCGPCMRALPGVKATYAKLNPKGFEIIGISFDQKKDALTELVAREGMKWPQYFDGKGWGNEFGQRFGIDSIPAMWLIDRQGNLRDVEAHDDLEGKVSKLLAESAPAEPAAK